MKDHIRKINPMDLCDVSAVQAWLEDLAAEGWYLRRYGPIRSEFQRGEPNQAVRCRLEPFRKKDEAEPDAERKAAYWELGWQYATTRRPFHIWQCSDPEAPELETDPVLQEEAYRYLLRRARRESVLNLVLLSALLLFYIGGVVLNPIGIIENDSYMPWAEIPLFAIILVALLVAVQRDVTAVRLSRSLKTGELLPDRRPYRSARWKNTVYWGIYVLFLVSQLLSCLYGQTHAASGRPFVPVDQWEDPVPYVSMAELDPAAEPATASAIDFRGRPLLGTAWWIHESEYYPTDVEEWDRQKADAAASLQTRYYRFRSSFLADLAEKQLLRRRDGQPFRLLSDDLEQALRETHLNALPIPPALDGAWWAPPPPDGRYQSLIIRRGRQIMAVWYVGPADLRENLAPFAALLEEFRQQGLSDPP